MSRNNPQPSDLADAEMRAALQWIMREADAAKEPCGMDPETPAAIRNGRLASIASAAAIALGMMRGPSFATPPTAQRHDDSIDRKRFERAPCYLCGYSGAGYFQPDTHPCAAKYHAHGAGAAVEAVAGPCSMGVGCDESGVCYAAAHGEPDRCPKYPPQQPSEQVAGGGGVDDAAVQRAEEVFWPVYIDCVSKHQASRPAHKIGMRAALESFALSTQPLLSDQPAGVSNGSEVAR